MKKLLSALLAVSLITAAVTGCGGNTEKTATYTTANTEETGTDSVSEAGNGDKVHINIYRSCFNIAQPNDAQVQKVADAINNYITDKINVELSITDLSSGEYADKVNITLVNNEINLLWTASWQGTVGTNELHKPNAVYDISSLLPGTTLYDSIQESI